MINACYADPGCAALINCQLAMCNNNGTLPDGAPVPTGGDCTALCISALGASAKAQQLLMNEDNCWEGCGPASTACSNECSCGSSTTGDDGGGTDDGGTGGGSTDGGGTDGGGTEGGGPADDGGGGG
jgi:hypothetical protein